MGRIVYYTSIFLFCNMLNLNGQNLIPNPGFEDIYVCPGRLGDLSSLKFWQTPSKGTPDYFNLCNSKGIYICGYSDMKFEQTPFMGNGYVSIAIRDKTSNANREYIQVKLKTPLISGKFYCFKMHVQSDSTIYPESIQFAVTKEKITGNNDLVITYKNFVSIGIKNSNKYIEISSVFKSLGGEEYLTVGQFIKDLIIFKNKEIYNGGTTSLFLDELSLVEVNNSSECLCSDLLNISIENGTNVELKNIFFQLNSSELKASSFNELNLLVKILTENPTVKIEISGHTDNTGEKTKNMELSEKRAKAVYDYLIKNGISSQRIQYKGFGDTKPLLPNTSDQNKAKNRRVEIIFNK